MGEKRLKLQKRKAEDFDAGDAGSNLGLTSTSCVTLSKSQTPLSFYSVSVKWCGISEIAEVRP